MNQYFFALIGFVAFGTTIGNTLPAAAALVLYSNMDNSEVSGSNVTAETGQSGTVVAGTVNTGVAGIVGEAFQFAGGRVDFNAPLGLTNTFSYAFWVKTSQAGQGYAVQNHGGSQSAILFNWSGLTGPNELGLWNTAGGFTGAGIPIAVDGNTWTHVAWTYDGSNFRGYKDGVLQNTTAYVGVHGDQTFWRIGGSDLGDAFQGTLDEFRIYNTALTDAEVASLANPVPEPGTLTLCGLALLAGCRARKSFCRKRNR